MVLICLTTIRHSGSHFFTDHLLKGWKSVSPAARPDQEFHSYIFTHFGDSSYDAFYHDLTRWPTVSPLRSPKALVESHKRRYQNYYWLERELERLSDLDKEVRISYLPLDGKLRWKHLTDLNERLHTDLQTDWPVIREATNLPGITEDPRKVDWVWDNYGHIFGRFYECD